MAYIPTTPLPNLPKQPTGGGFDAAGFALGAARSVLAAVSGGIAARRAGAKPIGVQAEVIRNLVPGVALSVPGFGVAGLIGALARLAVGPSTYPEYVLQEVLAGTPRGLDQPVPSTSPLGQRPGQLVDVGGVSYRVPAGGIPYSGVWYDEAGQARTGMPPPNVFRALEAIDPTARVATDPRTGAGVSAAAVRQEIDPERRSKQFATWNRQRVPYSGVPSIFTRMRIN